MPKTPNFLEKLIPGKGTRVLVIVMVIAAAAFAAWASVATQAEGSERDQWLKLAADERQVPGDGTGIGGTGYKPGDGNGIGGTGHEPGEGNGIGGTGEYVDGGERTGVVGAITGFGSIYVNGLHIDIDDDMPVKFKDRVVRAGELDVGHVVAVEAAGEGEKLRAVSASVQHEVGGPVSAIDRQAGTFVVLGQTIKAPKDNRDRGVQFAELRTGMRVDVSGFRTGDETIDATRLDRIKRKDADYVTGAVSEVTTSGFSVGGLQIASAQDARPAGIVAGSVVYVSGRAARGGLRPRRVRVEPALPFSRPVARLSIEGFVVKRGVGAYRIGRWRIAGPAGAFKLGGRERIVITGGLGKGARILRPAFRPARAIKIRGLRIRTPHQLQKRRQLERLRTPQKMQQWRGRPKQKRKRPGAKGPRRGQPLAPRHRPKW